MFQGNKYKIIGCLKSDSSVTVEDGEDIIYKCKKEIYETINY
jgi:hypothetical protein